MNLAVVTSLLILLAISLEPAGAGRRCWCDARVNGRVIKSFGNNGVIASCGWLCGCRNAQMNRCGLTCDEMVRHWASTTCLKQYNGKQVRSHYKASTCDTNYGKYTYTCKYCSKTATKRVAYTKYKTVTKRVAYTTYKYVTQALQTSCPVPYKSSSGSSGGRSGSTNGRSGSSIVRSGSSVVRLGSSVVRSGSSVRRTGSSTRRSSSSVRSGISNDRAKMV